MEDKGEVKGGAWAEDIFACILTPRTAVWT